MLDSTLTSTSETIDGRLVHRYAFDSLSVPACDSMRNVLLLIEMFADESLDPFDKQQLLFSMLFPASCVEEVVEAAGERIGDLVSSVLWDACGLDVSGERPHEEQVFDWTGDAARIRASVMSAYGMDWDSFSTTQSFIDGCALLAELMEADNETPFRQAVYYRTGKPPKRTKYNADYVDGWLKARRHFALHASESGSADRMKSENDKAADMFAALKEAAAHGRR